jgi:biotin transport system substrate-specific component
MAEYTSMNTTLDSKSTARRLPLTSRRWIIGLGGAVLVACLTAVGAEIRIPLQPVPITLQTLFVLLSGAVLGSRFGSLSQAFYIGLGMLGAPLLAGATAGLAVVTGPSGGYLFGFVLAAVLVGRLISLRAGFRWHLAVFSMGAAVILALGVIHLTAFYTRDIGVAVKVGLLPFLLGDALKVFAAASIYGSFTRLSGRRSSP